MLNYSLYPSTIMLIALFYSRFLHRKSSIGFTKRMKKMSITWVMKIKLYTLFKMDLEFFSLLAANIGDF